ncbi:DnaB-like DNA helicase [Vibrio phage vB_VpS_PG28]|nr:DnaB-like DNA helicase [Vibrio phage vB_VpS_PG28]
MAIVIGDKNKNSGGVALGAVAAASESDMVSDQSSEGKYSLKKNKTSKNLSLQLIANLVEDGDLTQFDKYRPPNAALSEGDKEVFIAIEDFMIDYGQMPTKKELEEYMEAKQLEPVSLPTATDEYNVKYMFNKVIETASEVKASNYVKRYLIQGEEKVPLKERYSSLLEGISFAEHLLPDSKYMAPEESARNVLVRSKQNLLLKSKQGIMLGWEDFDTKTNGILGGNVVIIAARPSVGKTWLALNAAKASFHHGKRTKVISMEMTDNQLWDRYFAMESGVEANKISKYGLSTKEEKKVRAAIDRFKSETADGSKFLTMKQPLGRYCPEDLLQECRRDNIEFLVVDAAYMLSHRDPYVNKSQWDKLREVVNQIKIDIAVPLDIPVVCTYQLNKDVDKYQSVDDIDLDNLYGGDTTAQVASIVLAVWNDENLSSANKRLVKILKGRDGEADLGSFEINWDFDHMDFSQYKPEVLDQLPL